MHRFPLLAGALLAFPFLVGFDAHDSAGHYLDSRLGQGKYRFATSACSPSYYDATYYEAHLAMRHRFGIQDPPPSKPIRRFFTPGHTSLGYSLDLVYKQFDSVSIDPESGNPANPGDEFGAAMGIYGDFD